MKSEYTKVIVSGSRHFNDFQFFSQKMKIALQAITDNTTLIEIVHGAQTGVDTLAKRYAERNGLKCTAFPANWRKFGNAAGPIRNKQMAEYGDVLIAFLAKGSRGTKDMILQAKGLNMKMVIISLPDPENTL